jgi:hypothetical protein
MTNNPTTKIINHLNFLIESTTYSSAYLRALQHPTVTHTYCIGMLDRMRSSCFTLNTFFKDEDFELKYEFVAGIITRTILLDSFIIFNLEADIFNFQKEGKSNHQIENSITKYCHIILSDGLKKTLNFIKTAKDSNNISEDYQMDFYTKITEIYSDFFEPNTPNNDEIPKLKFPKQYLASELFDNIKKIDFFKKIYSLYDSYLYFSKYEHYGKLFHRTSNIDIEYKLETYLEVIESFVVAHTFLLDILNEYYLNDPFIQGLKAKSHLYISENLQ